MAFKYTRRSAEDFEHRASMQSGDFPGIVQDDYKVFAVADGDNFVRILPPTWGPPDYEKPRHYGFVIYTHYSIGPDNATVLCLAKMKNERCPICEARNRAERAGDEELTKELRATRRVLVWVVNRKDEEAGPMVWSMPFSLDQDIVKVSKDPRTGEIYWIDDPEQGYDVSFEKTGKKLLTKYVGVQLARRASSVDQDFIDYIAAVPVPDVLVWRDYDEIKAMYEGGGGGDPEPAKSKPATRKASRPAPEPDEEVEEEKPAAKPRFKARGSAKAEPPPADDEDEYGADPDEEVEEKIDKKTKTAATSPAARAAELKARFNRK